MSVFGRIAVSNMGLDNFWLWTVSNLFYIVIIYILLMGIRSTYRIEKKMRIVLFFVTAYVIKELQVVYVNRVWAEIVLYMIIVVTASYLLNRQKKDVLVSVMIATGTQLITYMIVLQIVKGIDENILLAGKHSAVIKMMIVPSVQLAVSLLVRKIYNIRNKTNNNLFGWILVAIHPVTTVLIVFILFDRSKLDLFYIEMIYAILLGINIIMVLMYDRQNRLFIHLMQLNHMHTQEKYFEKDLVILNESLEKLRSQRHDYIKHLSMIKFMVENGQIEKLKLYMEELIDNISITKKYVETSNEVMDSILNYMIQEAEGKNIKINHKVFLPNSDEFSTFNMTTILFNLIDNALVAVEGVETRWIELSVNYDRGRIFIETANPYSSIAREKTEKKKECFEHGFGLKNVRKIVEKYNGVMDINDENNIFRVKIMLYHEIGEKND